MSWWPGQSQSYLSRYFVPLHCKFEKCIKEGHILIDLFPFFPCFPSSIANFYYISINMQPFKNLVNKNWVDFLIVTVMVFLKASHDWFSLISINPNGLNSLDISMIISSFMHWLQFSTNAIVWISISMFALCYEEYIFSFSYSNKTSTNMQGDILVIMMNRIRSIWRGSFASYCSHCSLERSIFKNQLKPSLWFLGISIYIYMQGTCQDQKVGHNSKKDNISRMGTLSMDWTWKHVNVCTI